METGQMVDLDTTNTYIIRLILMELILQFHSRFHYLTEKRKKALPPQLTNSSNYFANNIRHIISAMIFGLWYFQKLSLGKSSAGMLIWCFSDLLHMYHIIITTHTLPFSCCHSDNGANG